MKNDKNIELKTEVIEMENHPSWEEETVEETVTTVAVKPKWSLKKKLMIGGGVLVGLVLGAVALGTSKTSTHADEILDDSDGDDEGNSPDEAVETVETETTEETA